MSENLPDWATIGTEVVFVTSPTGTIADKVSVTAADAGNPEAAGILSSLLRDAAIRARAWKEGIE